MLGKIRNPCITAVYMFDYYKFMNNLDESFYDIKSWHSECTT
jgi:hypothetical protein